MRKISPIKAGLTLGILLGLWHLCWAALVALGWAQGVVDFLFKIHFFAPVLRIQQFDGETAALLVIVTAAIGFVIGVVGALAWNQLHRAEDRAH
jgi:hypothetical protein